MIIKKIVYRLFIYLFSLLPLRNNTVLLSNFNGKAYGGNVKYIAEELHKNKKIKFYLIVDKKYPTESVPIYIKQVVNKTIRLAFVLSTSKVLISNVRMIFFRKRKNQLYIQTWHGDGIMKMIEKDAEGKLSPSYVKLAKNDSKKIDILISGSRFISELYYKSFWYNGRILECGFPRYDCLLNQNDYTKQKVFDSFHLVDNKKICLFAPTFRDGKTSFVLTDLDFQQLKTTLESRFGGEFVVFVRLHPNVAGQEKLINFDNKTLFNATNYPDVMELLIASDILISDYSSVTYEFSFKKAPVFRFVPDIEEYKKNRGFYFEFDYYPFPYGRTNDELNNLIIGFDTNKYEKDLSEFFVKYGTIFNPNSSIEISKLIFDFLETKNLSKFLVHNDKIFIKPKTN